MKNYTWKTMNKRKCQKKQLKKNISTKQNEKDNKQAYGNINTVMQRQERDSLEHPSNGNGVIVQPAEPTARVFGGSSTIVVPPKQNVEYHLGEVEYTELVNVREMGFWYSVSAFCFSWCLSFLYDIWKGDFNSSSKESNAWVLLFASAAFSLVFLMLAIKLSRKRRDIVSEIEKRYNKARGIDTDQEKGQSFLSTIKDFLFDENNDDL